MYWVIPCNPNYYNVDAAFFKMKKLDWRQRISAEVGDIVYIYVGKPYSEIRYKCLVRKVWLKNREISDDEYYETDDLKPVTSYMELELIEKYVTDSLPLHKLKMNGVKTVQGPFKVLDETLYYIEHNKVLSCDD